ncbi:MAG: hypothetical protein OQL28_16620 [Sedimenticola sp.]|nr:hypothetical protein [Sedimenticola sp.]
MNSLNSVGSALFDTSLSRALAPVQQPAAQDTSTARNQPPPPPPQAIASAAQIRGGLESRAGMIYQQALSEDGVNARNRQAIRAYRTTEEAEEREQVSRLLGVDEYA